jgi:3-hydroxyisobutyrate dehydrogenase
VQHNDSTNIVVVGGGEVGLTFATAAAIGGADVTVVTPRRPARATLHRRIRVVQDPAAVPPTAGRVWLCVPAAAASTAMDSVLPHLADDSVVADFTSSTAGEKRGRSHRAASWGVGFVDVAIMGSVAVHGMATPLWGSGADRQRDAVLSDFAALGAPVRHVGSEVGRAAAIKLLRSSIVKGLEALTLECFLAADRLGVLDDVRMSFTDIESMGFNAFLEMLVTSHVRHAPRRRVEVQAALSQVREAGVQPHALTGTERRFDLSADIAGQGSAPAVSLLDGSPLARSLQQYGRHAGS